MSTVRKSWRGGDRTCTEGRHGQGQLIHHGGPLRVVDLSSHVRCSRARAQGVTRAQTTDPVARPQPGSICRAYPVPSAGQR